MQGCYDYFTEEAHALATLDKARHDFCFSLG